MKRHDPKLLLDMLLAGRRARQFVYGVSREQFDLDPMRQDALIRSLTVIGEAASRVSEETRAQHSGIPWTAISTMRNRLVHEYFRVDLDIIWNVATTELPPLMAVLERIAPRDPDA